MTGLNYTRKKIVGMLESAQGGMVSKEVILWECWGKEGKAPPYDLIAYMRKLRWDYGIPIKSCCNPKNEGKAEGWHLLLTTQSEPFTPAIKLPPVERRILGVLQKANGKWVPVEYIHRLWNRKGDHRPTDFAARMSRLRRFPGVVLESKLSPKPRMQSGRRCVTAYRLVPQAQAERLAA